MKDDVFLRLPTRILPFGLLHAVVLVHLAGILLALGCTDTRTFQEEQADNDGVGYHRNTAYDLSAFVRVLERAEELDRIKLQDKQE